MGQRLTWPKLIEKDLNPKHKTLNKDAGSLTGLGTQRPLYRAEDGVTQRSVPLYCSCSVS